MREEEHIERCARENCRFEDAHFPATAASLGPADGGGGGAVRWLRPDEAFGPAVELFAAGRAGATAIELGAARLQDCWLLGALAAVGARAELLQRLFVSTRGAAHGVYTLQLHWHGEWVQVMIDDRLPCDEQGVPLYARSGVHGELWPALVEKAWAKLAGSYAALGRGGALPHALRTLTGGVPVKLELAQPSAAPPPAQSAAPRLTWERLLHVLGSGAPCLVCRTASAAAGGGAAGVVAGGGDGAPDLLPGLAYPVLQARAEQGKRLVQLCSPWAAAAAAAAHPRRR